MNDQDQQAFEKWFGTTELVYVPDVGPSVKMAWTAALAYARQQQCRWVSVEERLPGKARLFFVLDEEGHMAVMRWNEIRDGKPVWLENSMLWKERFPTHWLENVPPVPVERETARERCLVCNGIGGHEEGCRGTSSYDELRDAICKLRTEVNCRIEHGADSCWHLEYVQSQLDIICNARRPEPAVETEFDCECVKRIPRSASQWNAYGYTLVESETWAGSGCPTCHGTGRKPPKMPDYKMKPPFDKPFKEPPKDELVVCGWSKSCQEDCLHMRPHKFEASCRLSECKRRVKAKCLPVTAPKEEKPEKGSK